MKLWLSGEITSEVEDAFFPAMQTVERAVNQVTERTDYGLSLDGWDCIAILRDSNDEDLREITRYSAKRRDMDFRLRLDYERFNNGTPKQRVGQLFDLLFRSLDILDEKGLEASGIALLRADVEQAQKALSKTA